MSLQRVFFAMFWMLMAAIVFQYCAETGQDGMDGLTGPRGVTGTTGEMGATGATGATGAQGSQTRTGFHVITFGDPSDISAPNSGGVLLNDIVLWDTVTSVPSHFTIRIPGTDHPDDVIEIFGTGSKTRIRHHFEGDTLFQTIPDFWLQWNTDRIYVYSDETDTEIMTK